MKKAYKIIPTILALGFSTSIFAGGFEKVTQWSAKWSSLGGAATAGVEGSEALYFNPAGLIKNSENKGDVSLNVSTTRSEFNGPITQNSESLNSNKKVSPLSGAMGSLQLSDRLALGFGAYVAGGTKNEYQSVDYTAESSAFEVYKPTVGSDLNVIELSTGLGFKVNKNIRIGGALRASFASGNFKGAQVAYIPVPGNPIARSVIGVQYENLSDKKLGGFRLGAQYENDAKTFGLGASYRSEVKFNLEGKSSGQYINQAGPTATIEDLRGGGDITLISALPYQLSLGSFVKPTEDLTIHGEYTHTDYSSLKQISIVGKGLYFDALGPAINTIKPIKQNWKDQHNYKLGIEYAGLEYQWGQLVLRSGYAYTSQVVPESHARATFSTPNAAHTAVLGVGIVSRKNWGIDLAGEYSWAKGNVNEQQASEGDQVAEGINQTKAGEYGTKAYAFHTSLKYVF